MQITAVVSNTAKSHEIRVTTGNSTRPIAIPLKPEGHGSSVNGGEFLMLALATCYCNDLYREAARLGIPIDAVEVEASAEFTGVGLAANNITYRARVSSLASKSEVERLLRETDAVAEVHNTIRQGGTVSRVDWA